MANKQKVNFVVTDLDDTIWDWLNMWHSSFEPYLFRISNQFSVEVSQLKSEFKRIHQKYGSSEASFIHRELSCLSPIQQNEFDQPNSNQRSILHEYYSLKKNNLFLYERVRETLIKLKEKGVLIIGFTESNAFFTKYRLKHLELDGLIDYIYTPIDSGVPESVYRHYSEDYWEPDITEIRYLSKEIKKPAPEILEIILRDFKAKKENSIYIGDKLDKDVFMANEANVVSVYAKYGNMIDSKKYQLLRDVTHWTDEDVERENIFKVKHKETPLAKYVLKDSFDELFNLFEFFNFDTKSKISNISNVITIWKKSIEVQQHFNDIELKIRTVVLTTFTFIIGGIGYLENLKDKLDFSFRGIKIPFASLLAFAGIIIILSFCYMDKNWYHRLLKGAVKHAKMIERQWSKYLPEINLTETIGAESPHKFLFWEIHSNQKYYVFYGSLVVILLCLGIILLF